MKTYIIFLSVLLFIGCQKQDLTFQKINGKLDYDTYKVKFKDSNEIQLSFDDNGNLVSIINKTQLGNQLVTYYETGMVEAKGFLDNNDKAFGRIYYFHEKSGHLISVRQFVNDTLDGYQFDYYDQEGTDSMHLHYIKGECMGRLVFNKKEEGIGASGSFIAK